MSKGDGRRPTDWKKWDKGFDQIDWGREKVDCEEKQDAGLNPAASTNQTEQYIDRNVKYLK